LGLDPAKVGTDVRADRELAGSNLQYGHLPMMPVVTNKCGGIAG
jgi:hypothetical protein